MSLPSKALEPERVAIVHLPPPTLKTVRARTTVTKSPFTPKKAGILTWPGEIDPNY